MVEGEPPRLKAIDTDTRGALIHEVAAHQFHHPTVPLQQAIKAILTDGEMIRLTNYLDGAPKGTSQAL